MISKYLTEEQKTKFYNDFIRFFKEERDENIGIIQADKFLDFFIENLAPILYNKAIDDSKISFEKIMDEFDFHLEELKK